MQDRNKCASTHFVFVGKRAPCFRFFLGRIISSGYTKKNLRFLKLILCPCTSLKISQNLFLCHPLALVCMPVSLGNICFWNRTNQVSLLRQLVFGLTAAKFVLAITAGNPISEDLLNRQALSCGYCNGVSRFRVRRFRSC